MPSARVSPHSQLRDVDPTHGLGAVRAAKKLLSDARPVFPKVRPPPLSLLHALERVREAAGAVPAEGAGPAPSTLFGLDHRAFPQK